MPDIRIIPEGSTEQEFVSRMKDSQTEKPTEPATPAEPTADGEGAKPEQNRDVSSGRYVSKDKDRGDATPESKETDHPEPAAPITEAELAEDATDTQDQQEPETPTLPLPDGWSDALQDSWDALDPEAQERLFDREKDSRATFTKRSQDIAEEGKKYQSALQDIEAERQHYQEKLQPMLERLGERLKGDETRLDTLLDPDSESYSPERYRYEKNLIEQQQTELTAARTEAGEIEKRAEEQRYKAYTDDLAANELLLVEAIPEWKTDPAKGRRELEEIREYVVSQGIPREQVDGIYKAPVLLMARKAMQLDQQAAARLTVKGKKKVPAPKLTKPGVKKAPEDSGREKHVAARRQLRHAQGTRGEGKAFVESLKSGRHVRA